MATIVIQNISEQVQLLGWQDYEVRIDGKVVAQFGHKQEDGLASLFIEATKAVESVAIG